MSQRLEAQIVCLSNALTTALSELCEKIEAQVNKSPIVGEPCCVLIDGVAGYASPLRIFDGETGTLAEEVSWVDPDTLAPIAGVVEPADPCECPCLECEAVVEEGGVKENTTIVSPVVNRG